MQTDFSVSSMLADKELVKAMVGNLSCISFAGAAEILDAFKVRAVGENPAPHTVAPSVMAEVLDGLPALPGKDPGYTDYRYRADSAAIRGAWALLDSATSARIRNAYPAAT
ncbi:hypothetical protein [Paracidovorax valerianellae]|uniref:hypothetical protein n=1 Tax=Paracidovorax valerianellae TaxID=187868 RepID=UPI0023027D80|nr:hypothetical protein [Paracidovorax valerianellae]MDA8444769.1 hypothetical protein [Paracidovorax valerianellae]UYL85421.1 hypothetical protein gp19 [Acidovorax phage Alfacinha3]UYL85522.1 hypothetical protein gp19 [Acidovorax phage Alfacinha1]